MPGCTKVTLGVFVIGSLSILISIKSTRSKPTLQNMQEKKDVLGLIRALKHTDDDVRQTAIESLGQFGDTRAVEPLMKILNDNNKDVQIATAQALAQIGDTRAVEPLVKMLDDDNKNVRTTAAQALAQIGDTRVVGLLFFFTKVA